MGVRHKSPKVSKVVCPNVTPLGVGLADFMTKRTRATQWTKMAALIVRTRSVGNKRYIIDENGISPKTAVIKVE